MKISCNILKKYIKNSENIDFATVFDKLFAIRTAEIDGIEIKGNQLKDVVVAEIVECDVHPKKDKYHILKVDIGTEIVDILCGAPNARKGLKTALVKVGGMVSGFTIEAKEIAGVLSHGMLCSEAELGIGSDHSGIIEFPDSFEVGKDIKEYLPIDDIIIEIDNKSLTNRPDLWGHYGIAREICAITNHQLLPLDLLDISGDLKDLDINIKTNLCTRYTGLKIDNITSKIASFDIKIALFYCGIRSISLLVDLTNYVMIELGQPMHAFDSERVKKIEVDLGDNDTNFITLDSEERKITNETIMIKKDNQYFAIAGIMGGLDSEITNNTSSIILESACFDSTSIRKTATRLGLRTDSSTRYEKSLDPNMTIIATKRYIKLLKELDNNITFGSNITDVYPKVLKSSIVTLDKSLLYRYMGFEISDKNVTDILKSLDFKVTVTSKAFKVIAPTNRSTKDIKLDADIIEEIVRIYGHENLVKSPLKLDLTVNNDDKPLIMEYEIKKYLATKYNLNEVNTYIWYKTDFLKKYKIIKQNVMLKEKNEDNILRDDIVISLLDVTKENIKNYSSVNIFEIGTTIIDNNNVRKLGLLLTDDINEVKNLYYEAKEIVVNLIKTISNNEVNFYSTEDEELYDHILNISVDKKIIGNIKISKIMVNNKKISVAIDIDIDKLTSIENKIIIKEELSKYPSVYLDYTIISDKNIKYSIIEEILDNFKSQIIQSRELTSVYEKDDKTTYTIRYMVGSNEKTLTTEELDDFKNKFITYIKKNNLNIIE